MSHRARVKETTRKYHVVMDDLAAVTDIRTPPLWQKKRQKSRRFERMGKRNRIAKLSRRANRRKAS